MTDTLKIQAEVVEVKAKKTASLDVTYRVILHTNDPAVLSLGALDGDAMLNVEIGVDNGN